MKLNSDGIFLDSEHFKKYSGFIFMYVYVSEGTCISISPFGQHRKEVCSIAHGSLVKLVFI